MLLRRHGIGGQLVVFNGVHLVYSILFSWTFLSSLFQARVARDEGLLFLCFLLEDWYKNVYRFYDDIVTRHLDRPLLMANHFRLWESVKHLDIELSRLSIEEELDPFVAFQLID